VRRKSLPVPVFLKRLAIDLRVFCILRIVKSQKTQPLQSVVKAKAKKICTQAAGQSILPAFSPSFTKDTKFEQMPAMMESQTGHDSFTTRIHGFSTGRIRRLAGFQSFHRVPNRIHAGADQFIQAIGQQELSQQVEQLHAELRQVFGYKRRSMSAACDDGQGQLRTPDFHVDLHIQQDPQSPKQYQIVTEVSVSKGSEMAEDPRFHRCFNALCDTLSFSSAHMLSIADCIDRIEELPELFEALSYPPDLSRLELMLVKMDLSMCCQPHCIEFQLIRNRDLSKLLQLSQKLLQEIFPEQRTL
jgi:hypothetical protein